LNCVCVLQRRQESESNSPVELHSIIKLNEYVTIQEPDQLTKVTKLPAEAFTSRGNIYNKISFNLFKLQNLIRRCSLIKKIYVYLWHYNPRYSWHAYCKSNTITLVATSKKWEGNLDHNTNILVAFCVEKRVMCFLTII